jgi:hypothetical protein
MSHHATPQSANNHTQSLGSIVAALIAVDVAEERDVVDEAIVAGTSALIGMIVATTLAKGKRDGPPTTSINDTDAT